MVESVDGDAFDGTDKDVPESRHEECYNTPEEHTVLVEDPETIKNDSGWTRVRYWNPEKDKKMMDSPDILNESFPEEHFDPSQWRELIRMLEIEAPSIRINFTQKTAKLFDQAIIDIRDRKALAYRLRLIADALEHEQTIV